MTHAPSPYQTVDVGNGTNGFHTYIIDRNKRKIGVAWGPKEEKVWTAALWAAAPDLLEAAQAILASSDYSDDQRPLMDSLRAAVARAIGSQ